MSEQFDMDGFLAQFIKPPRRTAILMCEECGPITIEGTANEIRNQTLEHVMLVHGCATVTEEGVMELYR